MRYATTNTSMQHSVMNNTEIKDWVRDYIIRMFLAESDGKPLRDNEDLLSLLDSLQILRTIVAIEGAFQIKVDNSDLTPENLGSIEKIASLVGSKQGGSSSAHETPS